MALRNGTLHSCDKIDGKEMMVWSGAEQRGDHRCSAFVESGNRMFVVWAHLIICVMAVDFIH